MKEVFEYTINELGNIPADVEDKMFNIHRKYAGKKMQLTLTNERKRTTPQNSWFHKVNSLVCAYLRNKRKEQGDEDYYKIDEEWTKYWIKVNFLGYELDENGEKRLRKTSNLKTFEMNELWENLQIYFAPRGLDIPNPNEDKQCQN